MRFLPKSRVQKPETKMASGFWLLVSGFCLVLFGLMFLLAPPVFAFEIPANDGFVTDMAGIISPDEEVILEQALSDYRTETSNEIAILIINSLDGEVIADLAFEIGREWGIGTGENDNGIMILMSYEDRKIFIATGYGLEGAIPDIVAKGIIDRDILPEFRDGNYYAGFSNGVDSIKKHIGGEYTAERYESADIPIPSVFGIFMFFVFIQILAAFLGKSKSWWLGGILGAGFGLLLVALYSWWLSIPILTIIGLLFDYIVSKKYKKSKGRRGRHGGFWTGGGSGGSSGGFGGFSGGSFGGGGAGGSW